MSLEIATFLGKVEEDESHQKCDYKFHQTPCSCFALSSALSMTICHVEEAILEGKTEHWKVY